MQEILEYSHNISYMCRKYDSCTCRNYFKYPKKTSYKPELSSGTTWKITFLIYVGTCSVSIRGFFIGLSLFSLIPRHICSKKSYSNSYHLYGPKPYKLHRYRLVCFYLVVQQEIFVCISDSQGNVKLQRQWRQQEWEMCLSQHYHRNRKTEENSIEPVDCVTIEHLYLKAFVLSYGQTHSPCFLFSNLCMAW